jgi:hypothetical protein
MGLTLPNFAYPISNVIVPQGRAEMRFRLLLDFSNVGSIDVDGQAIIDAHGIEYIQGVFIDNATTRFRSLCNATRPQDCCRANIAGLLSFARSEPAALYFDNGAGGNRKVNLTVL